MLLALTLSAGCGGNDIYSAPTTLTLSDTSFDFGADLVGNTLTQTVVKVTNSGNYAAIFLPTLTGDPSFSIVANQSCGVQLAASASCNVVISYLPTSASSPAAQRATLNLNPGNVTAGTSGTVTLTGTSASMAVGQVISTSNPQVAQYTINPPFPGTVTVSFGTTTGYGLQTSTQAIPPGGGPVSFYVAGMRANTLYHMQASMQFDNGLSATDTDHTFMTTSYPPNLISPISATTTAGQTPQPGIEMVNLLASSAAQVLAIDLSGNVLWAYTPSDVQSPSSIETPKQLPNGDFIVLIGVSSTYPLNSGPVPSTALNAVREFDLAGNTVREITMAQLNSALAAHPEVYPNPLTLQTFHHDVTPLPNGHWLVLANTLKSVVLNGTTTTTTVLGDVIVDLDTNLNPVWVWNEFDHLDVNRHPANFPDWTHTNAVVYSKDDGNLLVSMRHQNWIVKVDYTDGAGTGNILWRLGYQGDFALEGGTDPADWFSGQHWPNFTTANTTGTFGLVVMDNGDFRTYPSTSTCATTSPEPASCLYTTVPILQLDESAKTAKLAFHQILPVSLYNSFGGNAEELANGNIEYDLCGVAGPSSQVFEVTDQSTPQAVWNMTVTGNNAYRAYRLPSLYPGVQW
jgi:arylsulfate sulfotransferase